MDTIENVQNDAGMNHLLKMLNMDAALISELDRLAAEYDMNADECLMELMRVRAEQEGTEAVRIMFGAATDLWADFKPGSKRLKYWAASREARQAVRDGLPGDHSAYAIMKRDAQERRASKSR